MFAHLKALTIRIIVAANVVIIILMLLMGNADRIDPREHSIMETMGLAFPVVLALNVVFLVFWLVFKWRYAIIPLAGFAICWGPVRRYCPLNISTNPPAGAIKVVSYNVLMFNPWGLPPGEMNPIVDYLVNSGADIICLQESGYDVKGRVIIDSAFAEVYQYRDTVQKSDPAGDVLSLYSKFPILHRERILYKSKGNLSVAYVLDIKGNKVLLVNNHLETVGLNHDDKTNFHSIVHGEMGSDSTREESKLIIGKVAEASRRRAPQADAVAAVIARYKQKGMSVIVCGDFNDSPLSYAHRKVAEGLTDCYVESGFGPGWSYHRSGIRVRIDNILCSSDFIPYGAEVDKSISRSDHYPIICWLKKR